ncbi:hypothetical protein ACM7X0_08870 [Pseudomonas aeruginosa]|uniref:hypothetical protein n=1 Tax=Achromobacter sp. EB05 TaxID=3142974 RepID=UPI0023491394
MSTRTSKGQKAHEKSRAKSVVRRAFSMQESDARLIETLRLRCAAHGMLMNQSEVVRIGLQALADMTDEQLCDEAAKLERLAGTAREKVDPPTL